MELTDAAAKALKPRKGRYLKGGLGTLSGPLTESRKTKA